jgi:hypothetical protein
MVASSLAPALASPQIVDPDLWGLGLANVTAIARSGNTLYVGGAFSHIGPNTGSGIPIQFGHGTPAVRYAKVNGEILAAVADGEGGWFIGGDFTAVGGRWRRHLAHILAGGEVAEWSPDPDNRVHALALAGGTLYVGGQFDAIAGQPRSMIAALDVATGQATSWDPSATGGLYTYRVIAALALRGDTVCVGGNFTSIGGQPRRFLAAVDARTGQALAWDPNPDEKVNAIALSENSVYVGGLFSQIGGRPRYLVAAVDLATGAATDWDPHITNRRREYWEPPPNVMTLFLRGNTVFIGGLLDSIGGQFRSGLGVVDAATAAVTGWDARPSGGFPYSYVRALAARADTIYVGGYFSNIRGVARICLAGLDATTAAPTEWDPRPNDEVNAIALDENCIYAAGNYHTLGTWQTRFNLAALDLTTGRPTDWNPDPNGLIVEALAVKDGVVYAGGDFTSIGGQARSGIAALDAVSGAGTAWNPNANGAVGAIVVRGDTLYAGGGFTRIGGQPRSYLAALDAATGLVTSWNPSVAGPASIYSMALSGNTIFVGGDFAAIGARRRVGVAAVDATTGADRPWRADANGWVNALAMSGDRLYVAGRFDTIAGEPRTSLAALDAATGTVAPWNPRAVKLSASYGPPRIHAIAALGHDIYVGGDIARLGGQPRVGFAAVDDSVGDATGWNPGADAIAWSLNASGSTLFVGGKFRTIGGLPTASLAVVLFPPPAVPPPPQLTLAQSAPNPARTTAVIHFALPADGPVTLQVFDVQGRRVATLLDRQPHTAGGHDFLLRADVWGPGVYFYRLEAAGRSATRRLVVLR